jgi:radical SAM protein with 4Fe4S-binding SPASM domain
MKTVFWETTKQCNMNCRQCSNLSGKALNTELTLKEIILFCSDLISLGLKDFRFYGGEPFLRKDIDTVAHFLANKNVEISFYTNGSVLNDEVLNLLDSIPKPRLFVSLDGATHEVHDDIRGVHGSFDIVVNNISSLRLLGYKVDIITTISRKNIHQIGEIFSLGKKLGVSSVKPNIISKIGRARDSWDELSLTLKQLSDAAKCVFEANNLYFKKSGIRKPCVAGIDEIYLSSTGDVFPCALLLDDEYYGGNIRDRRIGDILKYPSDGYLKILRSIEEENYCGDCNSKIVCRGGCRARALLESNNIDGKDTFSCLYQSFYCAV